MEGRERDRSNKTFERTLSSGTLSLSDELRPYIKSILGGKGSQSMFVLGYTQGKKRPTKRQIHLELT